MDAVEREREHLVFESLVNFRWTIKQLRIRTGIEAHKMGIRPPTRCGETPGTTPVTSDRWTAPESHHSETLHFFLQGAQKAMCNAKSTMWKLPMRYDADIGGITLVRNRKEATMMIQQ